MNILYFIADGQNEYNSSRWRVSSVYNAINRSNQPHMARIASSREWMAQTDYAKELCQWADIITIQRVGIDKSIPAIKHWRTHGKAVVIDYDDDYFRINKSNAAFKFWGKGLVDITVADGHKFETPMETHPLVQFMNGMKAATAVTMPSELLARDASKFCNSFFIPNYLEQILYPEMNHKPFDENKIIIGWGGSLSHIESFEYSGIVPALKTILSTMGNVYLLIVGDERVVAKLQELGVPKNKIIYHPYVSYDRWYQTLKLYDIGIAPLAQEYDMRRSWIKVAEYMSMGIPFVATDTAPYQNPKIRSSSRTGFFVPQGDTASDPNEQGWLSALTTMINRMPEIKLMAELDAEEKFESFLIDNNIQDILDTYQQIIDLENGW